MPAGGHGRFPWLATALLGGLAIGGLAYAVRFPSITESRSADKTPALVMADYRHDGEAVLREKIRLMDPSPLFLPSELSWAERNPAQIARAEGGVALGMFAPKLLHAESGGRVEAGGRLPTPSAASETLTIELPRMAFQGLASSPAGSDRLPGRGALVSAVNVHLPSRQALAQVIAQDAVADLPDGGLWAPMEFLVVMGRDGVVGSPTVVASSGTPEVDEFFREFLRKSYRMGAHILPGVYRLQIGP